MIHKIKSLVMLISTVWIIGCFNKKTDSRTIQLDCLNENRNSKIELENKFLDYEHLIFDKSSEIKYLTEKLNVLHIFIINFYFGEHSADKNNLIKFYKNNKNTTVFEKGQNILVDNVMFIYQDDKLTTIKIVE